MVVVKRIMRAQTVSAFLMLALAGCAHPPRRVTSPTARESARHVLSEAEVLAVARQAHATMTVYPAKYKMHGLTAERQGTNWTVHVWLLKPGSSNPLIADTDSEGEVLQISGDGRILSYDPNVFP